MDKTKETPGPVTELPKDARWNPGFSPADLVEALKDEIEDVLDLVVVLRYGDTSRHDDTYTVSSSSMSVHSLLGILELGKLMSVQTKQMGPGEEPEEAS